MTLMHARRRPTTLALVLTLVIGSVFVGLPTKAKAADMWTTPGTYTSGGRQWRTLNCERYSATQRCRTEIWGTTVRQINGRFVQSNEWLFNNLTYVAAPRSLWAGNPLATPGYHTINGRKWYTECDTAKVGLNVCKAWVWSYQIAATRNPDYTWSYAWVNKWVYNNQVRFLPATKPTASPTPSPTAPPPDPDNPCPGETYPAGYTITDGKVHGIHTPYQPNTLYNPTNIANFALKSIKAGQTCLAQFASQQLVAGGVERTSSGGVTAMWFPYPFTFSANPSTDTLQSGWISGLAQGIALSTFRLMYGATDPKNTAERAKWLALAKSTYRSYQVPLSQGGFRNEIPGKRLWFEEYPSSPVATHVLNGHLEAIIGLGGYAKWMTELKDPDAREASALFNRAVTDLAQALPAEAVAVSQGIVSSYELVRGYPSAPLRLLSTNPRNTSAKQVLPSGPTPVSIPVVSQDAAPGPNLVANGTFDRWSQSVPTGWAKISGTTLRNDNGGVAWTGNGRGWTGIQQDLAASQVSPGARYRVSWAGSTSYPAGVKATSGRVVAYAMCPGKPAQSLAGNNITRSRQPIRQDMLIQMPTTPGCGLKLQLLQLDFTLASTTVRFDNVELRQVNQAAGAQLTWPMEVLAAPQSKLLIAGTGNYVLQAYLQGRWIPVDSWTGGQQPRTVTVPEQFTGRNLHWGYHETHVYELLSLARLCDSFGLSAQANVMNATAQQYRALAPGAEDLFGPNPGRTLEPTRAPIDLATEPFDEVPPASDPSEANQDQS